LIDAYLNTLLGVDYYDKFRFKMIDERKIYEEINKKNTISVTSSVKIYHIPSSWIKDANFSNNGSRYCINIMDTPGFGDTRGLEMELTLNAMI
jgi:hypothetical protein